MLSDQSPAAASRNPSDLLCLSKPAALCRYRRSCELRGARSVPDAQLLGADGVRRRNIPLRALFKSAPACSRTIAKRRGLGPCPTKNFHNGRKSDRLRCCAGSRRGHPVGANLFAHFNRALQHDTRAANAANKFAPTDRGENYRTSSPATSPGATGQQPLVSETLVLPILCG